MSNINVIKFGASWCKPCKELSLRYEEVMSTFDSITFETFDISDVDPDDMEVMNKLGVTQVPSIVVKVDGVNKGFIQTSNPEKIISFIRLFL